jgi:hypothetical protein
MNLLFGAFSTCDQHDRTLQSKLNWVTALQLAQMEYQCLPQGPASCIASHRVAQQEAEP